MTDSRRTQGWLVAAAATTALAGCGLEEPEPAPPAASVGATAPAPSPWHIAEGDDAMIAVSGSFAVELAAASVEARATAADASDRWRDEPPGARARWAVKWRAETSGGGVEFVWVEPLHWSHHRIEGRLASIPNAELACGKTRDDLVGFPTEELADWIREADDPATPPEGGFTVKLLEAEFGRAPEAEGGLVAPAPGGVPTGPPTGPPEGA